MDAIRTPATHKYGVATRDIQNRAYFADLSDLLDALIDAGLVVDSYYGELAIPLTVGVNIYDHNSNNRVLLAHIHLSNTLGNIPSCEPGIDAVFYRDVLPNSVKFVIGDSIMNCKDIIYNFIKNGTLPESTAV